MTNNCALTKPLTPMKRHKEIFSLYRKVLEKTGFSLVTLTGTKVVKKSLEPLGLEEHSSSEGYGCYYPGYGRDNRRGVSSDYLLLALAPDDKTNDQAISVGLEVRYKSGPAAVRFTLKKKNGTDRAPLVMGTDYLTVPDGVSLIKSLSLKSQTIVPSRTEFLDIYAQLVFNSPTVELALALGKDKQDQRAHEILSQTGILDLKKQAEKAEQAAQTASISYFEELKQTSEYSAVKKAEEDLQAARKKLDPVAKALAKKHRIEELDMLKYTTDQAVALAVHQLKKTSVF